MNTKLFFFIGVLFLLSLPLISAPTPTANYRFWIDCDSDEPSCETSCGFTDGWMKQDKALNYTPFGYTMPPIPGYLEEYNDEYEECCGDDAFETIVTQLCNATRDSDPRCCLNESNNYSISDGTCVEPGFCPDIMRGEAVWLVESNDTLLAAWDAILNPDSYCCNGVAGTWGPLCGSEKGCYLTLNSLPFAEEIGQYPPQGPEYKQWCSTNTTYDPYCVAQACTHNVELCERSEVCNERTEIADNAGNTLYCPPGSYTVTQVANYDEACYPTLKPGCDPADYTDCHEVNETQISGVNCKVRCQHYENGTVYSCHEVCENYITTTVTTYRGPHCRYDPPMKYNPACEDMQDRTCSTHPEVIVTNPSACSPELNPPQFYEVVDCSVNEYCDPLNCVDPANHSNDSNQYCWQPEHDLGVSNNFTLLINDVDTGELFTCSDDADSQNQGDYWCPDGYEFDLTDNRCELDTVMCDSGPVGSPNAGCNDLLNPGDDYWLLYDNDCVDDVDSPSTNIYTQGCCAGAVIGSFQVYVDEDVVVY